MVSTFQMPAFYRSPLTVDTNQAAKFFDDEDSILDEHILDQNALDSGLEMSPPMVESRRDSFAVSTTLFSPKTEDWQSVEMQSVPSTHNNPFIDPAHSNNPFLRMDASQQAAYGTQTSWPMTTSASATPLHPFDGLPTEFDSGMPLFPSTRPVLPAQTPFGSSNNGTQVPLFPALGPKKSLPASPQKDHPWAAQDLKNPVLSKRPRPHSPPLIRSHNELRRGDGIRKKNARFDIPAERNLTNIDHLIAQSTDEQEIKELKQQKRLLRNRQAALDSRQRKKQHTERLEDEKKHYTEVITSMEDQIAKLETEMEQLLREKQGYQAYIRDMEMKQEDMIARHTLESGELRKKIGVLTSHVHSLESAAMNNASNNGGFSGPYGNMDDMSMDGPWDMPLFGEFTIEQPPVEVEIKQEMQIVPAKKAEVTLPAAAADSDNLKSNQQGGLLFMLFLVGAFVLSSRSTPANLPRVSEDVRAASASLLENVLKDAGVPQAAPSLAAMAPQPSGSSWSKASRAAAPIAAPPTAMEDVMPSMLGDLADSLTQPTEEQTKEQIFSLTAAQYNSLSSQEFTSSVHTIQAEKPTSEGRRNLAEALENMRKAASKESTAEVYTRSLLWDTIPADVVRNFAKMVAECRAHDAAEAAAAAAGGDHSNEA